MAVYGKRFRMEIIDEIMEYPLAESFKQYYYSMMLAGIIDSNSNTEFKIK